MSESTDSTIPITPRTFAEFAMHAHGSNTFGWLHPKNSAALDAFDEIINISIEDPEAYEHIRRFIYIDLGSRRATSVFTNDEDEHPELADEEPKRLGAYRFSLDILPRNPTEG